MNKNIAVCQEATVEIINKDTKAGHYHAQLQSGFSALAVIFLE
jgi:hypothetical protein